MLDPLRIAPPETREDLAYNFLLGILPEPVVPDWQTELRLAVRTVVARGGTSCGEVVAELERGNEEAKRVWRARIGIHASGGLARLGFARPDGNALPVGDRAVTSLRIRNLRLPLPGTPRGEMVEEERIGQAVLRLLAVYALRLTSSDPRRHSVLGFDEAWVLLADAAGRSLVDRISRLGRAQNVTPLLATQVLGDVDELEGLIGAAFCFGVETEAEARKALRAAAPRRGRRCAAPAPAELPPRALPDARLHRPRQPGPDRPRRPAHARGARHHPRSCAP